MAIEDKIISNKNFLELEAEVQELYEQREELEHRLALAILKRDRYLLNLETKTALEQIEYEN